MPHHVWVSITADVTYQVTVESRIRGKLACPVGGRRQNRSTKVGSGAVMLRAVHNSGNRERSGQP
jgi:hypothetical protein